jgi:hypothetical protein
VLIEENLDAESLIQRIKDVFVNRNMLVENMISKGKINGTQNVLDVILGAYNSEK